MLNDRTRSLESLPGERHGILFILSAPSGAGKTTIARGALSSLRDLSLSVSHTTRSPRPGEVDGRDYWFVTQAEFREVEGSGGFVESATVHGDLYGTPRKPLEECIQNGRDLLLDIDVQGARQIKQRYPDSVAIFLLPPSEQALAERLRMRGTDMDRRIQERLENAKAEIEQIPMYDFVVPNEDIDVALQKVVAIICAERQRVSRFKNLRLFHGD